MTPLKLMPVGTTQIGDTYFCYEKRNGRFLMSEPLSSRIFSEYIYLPNMNGFIVFCVNFRF